MNNGQPLPQKYVDELARLMGTRGGTKKAVERTKVSRSTLERAAYGAGVLRTTHTAIIEFLDREMARIVNKKQPSIEQYLEENRRRTKAALQVKKARGERTGTVPYGYQLAADGVHLEEHPAEQATIATVLEFRAQGLSLRTIVAVLERRGVTSRTGRRPLGVTQINRILDDQPLFKVWQRQVRTLRWFVACYGIAFSRAADQLKKHGIDASLPSDAEIGERLRSEEELKNRSLSRLDRDRAK